MIMKKIISNTKMLAALLMAGAAFTACSDKDEIFNEQPVPPVQQSYKMTVDATMGGNAQTRGLYIDNTALKVKWYNTDQVSVFPEAWSPAPYGTLTAAASNDGKTTLTGDLTTLPAVNNNLKLLFPRATWDYTGQKGILLTDANSIEKMYDYALADVKVNSVTGNAITTTTANFASQQAIVKFTLNQNASSMTISAASNKLVKAKRLFGSGGKTYHTGYTTDNGSGGFDGQKHENLVDGNLGSKWCTSNTDRNNAGGAWYIEFHTNNAVEVFGYMLRTAGDTQTNSGRNPKDWVLKGKQNSGDAWTVIDTKSNNNDMPAANDTPVDFDVDLPGMYQYFRLEISSARGGGDMQLSEMQLFTYATKTFGTAYGDLTVTPASATNELTVALRNDNGSDTYTIFANANGTLYPPYSKSGVNFEKGKYYAINLTLPTKLATSDITVVRTQQGGNISDGEGSGNLFDGNKNNKWCSKSNGAGAYSNRNKDIVVWKTSSAVKLVGYTLTTGGDTGGNPGRNWKSWTLYGGNFANDEDATFDAAEWNVIQTITDDTVLQGVSTTDFGFVIPGNDTSYQYYKLVIDAIQSTTDNIQQMSEMTLFTK